jgi:hypothetical protein
LTLRPWTDVPSIGFCGFVSNPLMRTVYRMRGQARKAYGLSLRHRVLRSLENSELKTNFIRRQTFLACMRRKRSADAAIDQAKVRGEFLDNLLGSDYALCVRGAGNFSIRFYEALSAGRIPVLINTQCVMPFDRDIDWRQHCLRIEESDIDHAADILLEFHRRLGDDQFQAMQMANRRLWQEWLQPQAFYHRALTAAIGSAVETQAVAPAAEVLPSTADAMPAVAILPESVSESDLRRRGRQGLVPSNRQSP